MSQDLILAAIKKNAKFFLDEAGEFYPFGMCITWENEIVPVAFNSDKESPKSVFVLEELKTRLKKYIESGAFSKAAIAFDVKIDSESGSQDAVVVLLYEMGKNETEHRFTYAMEDGEVKYI